MWWVSVWLWSDRCPVKIKICTQNCNYSSVGEGVTHFRLELWGEHGATEVQQSTVINKTFFSSETIKRKGGVQSSFVCLDSHWRFYLGIPSFFSHLVRVLWQLSFTSFLSYCGVHYLLCSPVLSTFQLPRWDSGRPILNKSRTSSSVGQLSTTGRI